MFSERSGDPDFARDEFRASDFEFKRHMSNIPPFQKTESDQAFVQKNNGNKKWLIVLSVVLMVIILAVLGLAYFRDRSKATLPTINQESQNGNMPPETGNVNPAPKLVRHGKMILQADKNSLAVNETFKVDILMDTNNSNIVVASAKVIYDPEILELVNIDEKNSALSMPVIKNKEAGGVEIIRGTPGDSDYQDSDDGYTGSDGVLASLEFKALKTGRAKIEFDQQESKMLLDDGQATAMVVEFGDVWVVVE